MTRLLFLVIIGFASAMPSAAQPSDPWVPDIVPRQFVAVIVSDLEASADWYARALGLDEIDRWTSRDGTIRGLNMARAELFVELVEIPDAPRVQRAQGLFKTGFWVPDVKVVADRVAEATGERPRIVPFPAHGLRLIQIKDPDGTTIQISEAAAGPGDTVVDPWAQAETRQLEGALTPRLLAASVADLDTSVAWYRSVLGFEEVKRYDFPEDQMRLAFLARDGFELELIELAGTPSFDAPDPTNPATRRGMVKLAFTTDAIDALYGVAQEQGARVQSTLRQSNRTGGRFFILLDPDGNWVQIYGSAE